VRPLFEPATLLLVVLILGQHFQAGVIERLTEQVGIRSSPTDLESRRLEVRSFMIRSQAGAGEEPNRHHWRTASLRRLYCPLPYVATTSSARASVV
jgi:hypothetical protein